MSKKAVFFAILLPCTLSIFAQESFTVEQAVASALKNNTTIEQGFISLQSLQRKNSRSLNGISPSLSLGAGVARPNENPSNMFSAYGTANISFTITSQSIANVKQAKLNYEAGIIDYETTVRSIELAVRKAFYGLLYEEIYIDLQRLNLEMAKSRYDQTLEKYRSGVIPELDVISAQVNYERLKPPLAQAEISYKNNLAAFKQLIGLDQTRSITLAGSLAAILDLKDIRLPEKIMSSTVNALEKQLESAKYGITSARASAYSPTVSLGFKYQPSMTSPNTANWPDGGSLSASILLPLDSWLPWSPSKENIDSAKDVSAEIALQLEEAKITARVNIESCMRNIEKSLLSIETGKANVELAKKSYEMMNDAYRRGTKDLLSLENAAISLFEAQVSLMSEAHSLITAVLDLESETGTQFGTLGM